MDVMAAELVQVPVNELTALDRCDRCGAQAYLRATVSGSELLFCAHHGTQHMDKLMAAGAEIYDERQKLVAG